MRTESVDVGHVVERSPGDATSPCQLNPCDQRVGSRSTIDAGRNSGLQNWEILMRPECDRPWRSVQSGLTMRRLCVVSVAASRCRSSCPASAGAALRSGATSDGLQRTAPLLDTRRSRTWCHSRYSARHETSVSTGGDTSNFNDRSWQAEGSPLGSARCGRSRFEPENRPFGMTTAGGFRNEPVAPDLK